MDYTVHGILQGRILEWIAFPVSRESSQPRDRTQVSHFAGKFLFPNFGDKIYSCILLQIFKVLTFIFKSLIYLKYSIVNGMQ